MKRIQVLFNYLQAYLPRVSPVWYMVAISLTVVVFTVQMIVIRDTRRHSSKFGEKPELTKDDAIRSMARAFCVAYVLLLFGMLVFSRSNGKRGYNIKPFWSYRAYVSGQQDMIYVVLFNVLLYVPYGFAAGVAACYGRIRIVPSGKNDDSDLPTWNIVPRELPVEVGAVSRDKTLYRRICVYLLVALSGMLISLAIELLQFWLNRGFAEFDDVFHNTLGTIVGCAMAVVMRKALS